MNERDFNPSESEKDNFSFPEYESSDAQGFVVLLDEAHVKLEQTEDKAEAVLLEARIATLEKSLKYIDRLDEALLDGKPLRPTQKLVALGYFNWLASDVEARKKLGKVVKPTRTGKTGAAIMMSEMTEGRFVFVAQDNSDAGEAYQQFRAHYGKDVRIGRCYGSHQETEGDVLIATFQAQQKWWAETVNTDLGAMVINEADIVGLSDKRKDLITRLAEKKGTPVIAMSATEQQGSGRKLVDLFPDDILRIPMPEALPDCLRMGLTPPVEFRDAYFDAELTVSSRKLSERGDLTDEEVSEFLKGNEWVTANLDYHEQHFPDHVGVVGFRDNSLIDEFIRQAKLRGKKAVRYAGDTDENDRIQHRDQLGTDVDFIVGSALVGRALNVPKAQIVYNKGRKESPQLFWQLAGRPMTMDEDDPGKVAKVITLLPKNLIDSDTGKPLLNSDHPLCAGTFLDKKYFDDPRRTEKLPPTELERVYDLRHLAPSDIRSMQEVMNYRTFASKHGGIFNGRLSHLSDVIGGLRETEMTYKGLMQIMRQRNIVLEAMHRNWTEGVDIYDEMLPSEINFSEAMEALGEASESMSRNMTLAEEKRLISDHKAGVKGASDRLLRCHLPLIINLAKIIAKNQGVLDVDDLVQDGCLGFTQALNKHKSGKKGRFVSYAIHEIWSVMSRGGVGSRKREDLCCYSEYSHVRYPAHIRANLKALDAIQAESLQSEKPLSFDEIALRMKISQNQLSYLFGLQDMSTVPWDDDECFVGEMNELDGAAEFVDMQWQDATRKVVEGVMLTLRPREERVLRMRYGFGMNDEEGVTLEVVGDQFGVTRERIRGIQSKAERKLKHPSRSNLLKPFFPEHDRE